MRAHGLKDHEPNYFEEARGIFDAYRCVDAPQTRYLPPNHSYDSDSDDEYQRADAQQARYDPDSESGQSDPGSSSQNVGRVFYESDEDRGSDYEDVECGSYDGDVCRSGVVNIAREEEPEVTTVSMRMAGYLSSVQGSKGTVRTLMAVLRVREATLLTARTLWMGKMTTLRKGMISSRKRMSTRTRVLVMLNGSLDSSYMLYTDLYNICSAQCMPWYC